MTVLEQQFYETMCRTMKSISNSLETICVKLDNIEKQLSKDETQNEIENEEKEDNER